MRWEGEVSMEWQGRGIPEDSEGDEVSKHKLI